MQGGINFVTIYKLSGGFVYSLVYMMWSWFVYRRAMKVLILILVGLPRIKKPVVHFFFKTLLM
jgi:hypothetical protein